MLFILAAATYIGLIVWFVNKLSNPCDKDQPTDNPNTDTLNDNTQWMD